MELVKDLSGSWTGLGMIGCRLMGIDHDGSGSGSGEQEQIGP